MQRLFRYSTCQFLVGLGFLGLVARSIYPTLSRAMFTFLHELPWNL
jgi:hypothetical protein